MKRNTAQLKENLIKVGVQEIQEKGIDNLSLRTVAQKCGVTHGTLYRHFANKNAYLEVVLSQVSKFFNQEVLKSHFKHTAARESLLQMGYDFVETSRNYPYFFEALFIKYPFSYLYLSEDTISSNHDLPGFNNFKTVILSLIEEESLTVSSAQVIIHLWAYIIGLANLANSSNTFIQSKETIRENINTMLTIYLKGGQA